jgi:hypothetical protein
VGSSWAITVNVPPMCAVGDGSTVASTSGPAAASAAGWFPTWIKVVEPVLGSILATAPRGPSATQTAPRT